MFVVYLLLLAIFYKWIYIVPAEKIKGISMNEEMHVASDEYESILNEIAKADSPVGIDAQKTHIIILHKLIAIEKRLNKIEKNLEESCC